MKDPKFVHLRVHTAYSLAEGAIMLPTLIHKLHDMGVPAVAVTDSANMFGGKAFSKYASEEGIKPILGCQFLLRNADSDDLMKSKGKELEPDKIVLLVMNATGYGNIMKLMKRFYLDNTEKGWAPQLTLENLENEFIAKPRDNLDRSISHRNSIEIPDELIDTTFQMIHVISVELNEGQPIEEEPFPPLQSDYDVASLFTFADYIANLAPQDKSVKMFMRALRVVIYSV